MEFLSLFQRKQKNTQAVSKSNASLERAADSILNQRGKQIEDHIGVRPQCWELRRIIIMIWNVEWEIWM